MKKGLSFLSMLLLLLFPALICMADTVEDFESGDLFSYDWTTTEATPWFVTTNNPHGGKYATLSPRLPQDEQAILETQVNCNQGMIDFWASVNGAEGALSLSFYIDDILKLSLSPPVSMAEATSGANGYSPYMQSQFEVTPGMHIFTWIYNQNQSHSPADAAYVDDITFPESPSPYLYDGLESGDIYALPWQTTGDDAWRVADENLRLGHYALESPPLGNNQSAALKLEKYCDAGELSFWMYVSSEQNSDYLRFYIDDELQDEWSGAVAYQRAAYPLSAGYHQFKWEYRKDDSGSDQLDSAGLDNLTFPGTANQPPATPTAVAPADEAQLAAESVILQINPYADPENDAQVRTYWLVRRADKMYKDAAYVPSFTAIASTGEELSQHTVNGLIPGMRYFWKAGHTDAGSAQTSWSKEYSFVILGAATTDRTLTVPPGAYMRDFKMVSFVKWPQAANSAKVFDAAISGTYDLTKYRIGAYDPLTGTYLELGDQLDILPGHAYWAFARNGLQVADSGVAVTTQDSMEVSLKYNKFTTNGWNMIASPNDFNYLWQNVEVVRYDANGKIEEGPYALSELPNDNGLISKKLWRWEDGVYDTDTTQIDKNQGYWVKARAEYVSLIFPVSAQINTDSSETVALLKGLKEGLHWIKQKILTPRVAVADDETPPLPMGYTPHAEDGQSRCFITSVLH